jgi:hypothetical protein
MSVDPPLLAILLTVSTAIVGAIGFVIRDRCRRLDFCCCHSDCRKDPGARGSAIDLEANYPVVVVQHDATQKSNLAPPGGSPDAEKKRVYITETSEV